MADNNVMQIQPIEVQSTEFVNQMYKYVPVDLQMEAFAKYKVTRESERNLIRARIKFPKATNEELHQILPGLTPESIGVYLRKRHIKDCLLALNLLIDGANENMIRWKANERVLQILFDDKADPKNWIAIAKEYRPKEATLSVKIDQKDLVNELDKLIGAAEDVIDSKNEIEDASYTINDEEVTDTDIPETMNDSE